ncbi:FecR family protein [Pseudoflavitalea rhizosphaerae]|uniref:FecR family protein n=1 Tax=Pseudoflavitalea rhizosphaerae TaxID=1884793 RepID=UPI000F8E85B3|nr:FecR family protein [Pseudoflavitalea rhizosphaerae]
MHEVEERLKELIVLKITKGLSEEQSKELDELKKIPGVELFIEKMTKEYLVEEIKVIKKLDERKPLVWDNMRPGIDLRKKVLTLWQKMAIAASFAIVVSGGVYLYLNMTRNESPVVVEKTKDLLQQDILPPEGTAILTLADGRKVALDGKQNAALVNQGGSSISNESDGLVYNQGEAAKEVLNTVTTPRGVMFSVTMADGTRAWLNTASSIRYPAAFTGTERRVTITGEVYFDVAKDAKRPFIVMADNSEIRVLGTQFNVNAYSNEPSVRTTLVTGKVEVGMPAIKDKAVLKPGQQARAQRGDAALALIKNADLEEVMGWRNDKFVFQGEGATIQEIMKQLQRYYDIDVEYQGKIPDDHFVAIMPRSLPISRILQVLQKTERIKFRIDDRKVIVMP